MSMKMVTNSWKLKKYTKISQCMKPAWDLTHNMQLSLTAVQLII